MRRESFRPQVSPLPPRSVGLLVTFLTPTDYDVLSVSPDSPLRVSLTLIKPTFLFPSDLPVTLQPRPRTVHPPYTSLRSGTLVAPVPVTVSSDLPDQLTRFSPLFPRTLHLGRLVPPVTLVLTPT